MWMQSAFRFLWRSDTRHIPTFLSDVQYFSMSQGEQEWAYCVNAKLCLFKLTRWISALPLCLSPWSRGFSACQILLLTIFENRGRKKSALVNSLSQTPSSVVSLRTAFFFFFFSWDGEELLLSCQLHCVLLAKACNTRGTLKISEESVAIDIQQKFLLQSTLPVNAGS